MRGTVVQVTAIGGSIGVSGLFSWMHNQPQASFALIANAVTGVPGAPTASREVQLALARPNPSTGVSRIGFTLARAAIITLAVYDVSGREIKRLLDDAPRGPGEHEVRFDTSALPNGLYLYRLRAGLVEITRKLVVTR
jgi:hypothetical protein